MKKLFFICLMIQHSIYTGEALSTIKGIGKGFASFGEHIGDVAKIFGQDLGHGKIGQAFSSLAEAPPGYVYSFKVFNDTDQVAYVRTQDYGSFMGGIFPIHGGPDVHTLQPFNQGLSILNKKYYFQMSISDTAQGSSNHMPYSDTNALYLQDCTKLPPDKNSSKINYFRTYIGKSLHDGKYVYGLRAEPLGFSDPKNTKNKGISIGSSISSLVIYNNTPDDIVVGYSSNRNQALTKKSCDIVTVIERNSFALLNATTDQPLNSGKLGLFESDTQSVTALFTAQKTDQVPVSIFTFPQKVFSNKRYTLEIYQDSGQNTKQMNLQGLMPGNYDAPTGRVRDITPIRMVFWHKSVSQLDDKTLKEEGLSKANYVDLPGQVWMVAKEHNGIFAEKIDVGAAVEVITVRPTLVEGKRRYYFLYVDTTDTKMGEKFATDFVNGIIGQDILEAYLTQAGEQVKQAAKFEAHSATTQLKDTNKIPEKLLIAAIQGSLTLHQGEITDQKTKITGYLLGSDIFLPLGAGASSTYYYLLAPSNNLNKSGATKKVYVPTGAVTNQFASSDLVSYKPTNLPVIKQIFNLAASN